MVQKVDFEHFEFLLPPNKRWFSPKEVAHIIGKSDQYVRDAFDNQKIFGHVLSGRAPKGEERRKTYQISRENLLMYLIQTANYNFDDFSDCLHEILKNRSLAQLLHIQHIIDNLIKHI